MAYRLSGYPSSVAVACKVSLVNDSGAGPLSASKSATPGAAVGAAPDLWGSLAHGTVLTANSTAAGSWIADGATSSGLSADSPYSSPIRVISGGQFFHRYLESSEGVALTAGTVYPFSALIKIGTSGAARIVFRAPSSGDEARLITTDFASVSVLTSTNPAGTFTGGTITPASVVGYYYLQGYFTPAVTTLYTFGVGPNSSTASEYVDLYGGAVALPTPPDPDPDPEGLPEPFAPEQWELLDAASDGSTLIVRIHELPFSNPALTFIGYRINGSDASIGFPSIAPGDYQITVPNETEASVLLRSTNIYGGVSSTAKTQTPTTMAPPAIGPADALSYSNAIYTGKAALDPDAGQIILIGATAISATSGTESYINGIRLYNGDGSQWHCRRWGDLQYVPNGAHDDLNSDEFDDVAVAWRRTGDVSDRTFTLRVYGSQLTGDDLARGVTVSTSMTLTATIPEDDILEVAFTAGGTACTPSLGGVAGHEVPAGKRSVQYLRAPSGGSAALTFTTTPSTVYARLVLTPGDAASIRRVEASRSGTTLSLDWRTMPLAGFPNTSGWTEAGGTPASPEIRNRNSGSTGFQIPTGYVEWKRFSASPTQSVFVHDFNITGANCVVKARGGFSNLLIYDGEGYGPIWSGSGFPSQGNFINPLQNTSAWPDAGTFWCYDTIFDLNQTTGNNEAIDGDAYIRNMLIDLHIMNGDWRDTGDAVTDMKGRACFQAMTLGQSQRAIRAWHHPTTYGRTRIEGPYSQATVNQSERGGIVAFWMVDDEGTRVRDYLDVSQSLGTSSFGYVADARQLIVMNAKPAYPAACDYAATDFEFEQSLDGGASWSTLSVDRTGPNDAWGATRRTVTVSTSITHVRVRALWGAKVGEWTTKAVTT